MLFRVVGMTSEAMKSERVNVATSGEEWGRLRKEN